jgi:hypothetical protein
LKINTFQDKTMANGLRRYGHAVRLNGLIRKLKGKYRRSRWEQQVRKSNTQKENRTFQETEKAGL